MKQVIEWVKIEDELPPKWEKILILVIHKDANSEEKRFDFIIVSFTGFAFMVDYRLDDIEKNTTDCFGNNSRVAAWAPVEVPEEFR